MGKINYNNFKYAKISDLDKPKGGLFNIYVDAWWVVKDECVLFYKKLYSSPQCNQNEQIAKNIRDRIYKDCEVRQIKAIYIPINPHDYV